MSTDEPFQIQEAILDQSQLTLFIDKLTSTYLPFCIPLLGRLQFFQKEQPPSSSAQVFIALSCPSNPSTSSHWINTWLQDQTSPSSSNPWLASFIDLSHAGQTQVWIFASWEPTSSTNSSSTTPTQKALITTLFRHIKTSHLPLQPSIAPAEWLSLQADGKMVSTPYRRGKVIFGTIHSVLHQYFPSAAITRTDPGYLKYIFPALSPGGGERGMPGLPKNLYFAPPTLSDLETVYARTHIPRTLATLRSLPGLAIYDDAKQRSAIGWVFQGKDGSLSSLHVEEEYRGQGLAVALVQGLFAKYGAVAGRGHADVSEMNTASRAVMKRAGGKEEWRVAWIEADLEGEGWDWN